LCFSWKNKLEDLDLATKTQGELPQPDDKISELPSTPSPSSSIIAPPRQQPRLSADFFIT
uniref:ICA69 domain-containing protein n=1 Tax=Brugia timori TaxID=42155 RepID=A0A0R3Q3X4_9BILA